MGTHCTRTVSQSSSLNGVHTITWPLLFGWHWAWISAETRSFLVDVESSPVRFVIRDSYLTDQGRTEKVLTIPRRYRYLSRKTCYLTVSKMAQNFGSKVGWLECFDDNRKITFTLSHWWTWSLMLTTHCGGKPLGSFAHLIPNVGSCVLLLHKLYIKQP